MIVKEQIVDEIGFERTISRLAHEILERNQGTGNIAIVGIRTRGEFIARRLRDRLQEIEAGEIPFGVLDITMYRDDLRQHIAQPVVRATEILFNITGRDVILVDDVLFTGRTVRSALDALMDLGRANTIQLAVLVDRGHRELPIRADFTGKNILTGVGEEIRVLIREVDGVDAINLVDIRD